MDSQNGLEESSNVSFNLDQEEQTIKFNESATLESIRNDLQNKTYTEVEFNHCNYVPVERLCEVIPSVNPNLQSLLIYNTPWINDECLELFTAYCNKLYKIELKGCLLEITRSGIESIGRNCGGLLSLSIVSTNDEKSSGKPGKCWMLDNRIFPALINNMTSKLRHFALSGFDTLRNDALDKFLSYFRKTLRSIDFSELSTIDDSVLDSIGDYCHNLFVMKFNYCKKITDSGIQAVTIKKSCLEVLELCGCEKLTDVSCDAISRNCPKLTILKMDSCHKLTELSLKSLCLSCFKLSHISLRQTALKSIPFSLNKLKGLNELNIDDCANITFPQKEILEKGLGAIQATLLEYDISNRVRCFLLGNPNCGKSSIFSSLSADQVNVSDGGTFGVPVSIWHPLLQYTDKSNQNDILSVEMWDCSGRKALEGVHGYFMNRRTIFVVSFNLSIYSSIDKVPKWISSIQSKAPGSCIIIVASHCDLSTSQKTQEACERVLKKIKEQEENQVREIKEELLFLRDLGLFSMIGLKRRKLEWLLENRPKINANIILVSSITGEGMDELKNVVIAAAIDPQLYPPYTLTSNEQKMFFALCAKKKEGIVIMKWFDVVELLHACGMTEESEISPLLNQLNSLGLIMFLCQYACPVNSNNLISFAPSENDLVCINPPALVNAIAALHRNDVHVQDLVNTLNRNGHIDALWVGNKPNDWTLRNTFTNISVNGMIRESIIPLLLYNEKFTSQQYKLLIDAIKSLHIAVSGAPNAGYDVELAIPSMKNLSVYKRYFLPLQGSLPIIPQVNAWLPKCPPTHVQIGWDYRFVSSVPHGFFLFLISACTVVKDTSETLSYWQSGCYIRNGDIDISVCQWKDKLVLQVLARTKVVQGTRQAVNRAWACLSRYLHTIERIVALFPGLYFEVLAVSNSQCKPILEVIDEFEAGEIAESEVLWYIPLKGCTRNSIKSYSLNPDYYSWLKSVSDQAKVHICHIPGLKYELRSISHYLEAASYEVTTDEENFELIQDAYLIVCLLTTKYLQDDKLALVKNNLKDKKLVLAVFEKDLSLEDRGHADIFLNKARVDISGGTGSGSSYQAEASELNRLVEVCNNTVFGHGSLGEELKRSSVATAAFANAGYSSSPSSVNKPFEQFADIIKQYSNMSKETELKRVAATAVAAAVAAATAEHIAKQSNPTMGAKAAAMAAEVADAVANGDSERAAQAVIATAKSVDEVVAFSNVRQSVSNKPNNNNMKNGTKVDEEAPAVPKSSMCVIL